MLELGTLIPRKEVEIIETVRATVIQANQAIKLRARKETRVRLFSCIWKTNKIFNINFSCLNVDQADLELHT